MGNIRTTTAVRPGSTMRRLRLLECLAVGLALCGLAAASQVRSGEVERFPQAKREPSHGFEPVVEVGPDPAQRAELAWNRAAEDRNQAPSPGSAAERAELAWNRAEAHYQAVKRSVIPEMSDMAEEGKATAGGHRDAGMGRRPHATRSKAVPGTNAHHSTEVAAVVHAHAPADPAKARFAYTPSAHESAPPAVPQELIQDMGEVALKAPAAAGAPTSRSPAAVIEKKMTVAAQQTSAGVASLDETGEDRGTGFTIQVVPTAQHRNSAGFEIATTDSAGGFDIGVSAKAASQTAAAEEQRANAFVAAIKAGLGQPKPPTHKSAANAENKYLPHPPTMRLDEEGDDRGFLWGN